MRVFKVHIPVNEYVGFAVEVVGWYGKGKFFGGPSVGYDDVGVAGAWLEVVEFDLVGVFADFAGYTDSFWIKNNINSQNVVV